MPKLLTIKEAAKRFGITTSSLYEWLDRHPEVKNEYSELSFPQKGKPVISLREEAMLVIANMKDKFRGNKSSKGNPERQIGKKKVAEHVIKTTQIPGSIEEALLKAVQLLVEHGKRLSALEGKAEAPHADRIMPKLQAPFSSGGALRPLLLQRINSFAKETGTEYQDIWNYLYRKYSEVYGVDLQELAKIKDSKPLDVAESEGHILALYHLAANLYRSHKSLNA